MSKSILFFLLCLFSFTALAQEKYVVKLNPEYKADANDPTSLYLSFLRSSVAYSSSPDYTRMHENMELDRFILKPEAFNKEIDELCQAFMASALPELPPKEKSDKCSIIKKEYVKDLHKANWNYDKDLLKENPIVPETCEWVRDTPRRIISVPGCGNNLPKKKACVGYVLCYQKSGLKYVRMSTCSERNCGENDAVDCTKEIGYSSSKSADGEENISQRFHNVVTPKAVGRQ
jgi:hypothetical protein